MGAKISQRNRFRSSVVPQDITTLRTGTFIDVSGAQRILAIVTTSTVAATKKITVKLLQARDAAGTGSKDLGTAADVVAPTGGAALSPTLDAQITDLDSANGYGFVAVQLSSDNATAVQAAALLMLGGNRYNP